MEVKGFEKLIDDAREEFRLMLKGYSTEHQKAYQAKIGGIIKKYLNKCCSTFEEETLKENLQEEFADYLKSFEAEGE